MNLQQHHCENLNCSLWTVAWTDRHHLSFVMKLQTTESEKSFFFLAVSLYLTYWNKKSFILVAFTLHRYHLSYTVKLRQLCNLGTRKTVLSPSCTASVTSSVTGKRYSHMSLRHMGEWKYSSMHSYTWH
jgi:hypothetical protein